MQTMRNIVRGTLAAGILSLAMPALAQQQQQARIQLNLSPAGEATVKRYLTQPDPQLQALAKQSQEAGQRNRALVTAPTFDLNRFATSLRQIEQLQGQIARRSNDRMLQLLRELSDADRAAFVRGMANPIPVPPPAKK